jgi:hypothetical protein
MTITRPAAATTLPYPHPLQTLRRWADATLASTRQTRRTPQRPTPTQGFAPPLTLWQIDRHELTTALKNSNW